MSPSTDPTPLLARIKALDIESVRLHSAVSGPLTLQTSLSRHFDQALGLGVLFPTDLRDHTLRQQLTDAFASEAAREHFNRILQRPVDSLAPPELVARLHAKLASTVIAATDSTLIAGLAEGPTLTQPYASCSLAQSLWARQACASRRDCFLAAAILLYPRLPLVELPPRAPASPLALDDYLALPTLVAHLLPAAHGEHQAVRLFNTLGADAYAQGTRYRRPTTRELQAGATPNQHGKVLLPGAALNAPAAQALDALLQGAEFSQWARQLADAAEWAAGSDVLALAEQALIDVLYPPETRQPGFIKDFDLFSPEHAGLAIEDIRLDLLNSLQASLDCTPALAALAGELLMRRFAPELLLADCPADFTLEPDLRWMAIHQGALIVQARQQPMTFDNAEQVLYSLPATDDPVPEQALRQALGVWAPLRGGFEQSPPWSDQQWQLALHRYLAIRDVASLDDLPDRFEEARRQLLQVRIDPDSRDVDNQLHLLRYLDHGAGYAHIDRLPDPSAWYESAFSTWEARAITVYQTTLQRCLSHLPQDLHEQLGDTAWTAYAVTWPVYIGRQGRPDYGASPEADWQQQTATQGLVIHAGDTLYELFPERMAWRTHTVTDTSPQGLAERLTLRYSEYNQTALPWLAADFPRLQPIGEAPTQDRLGALARLYASAIALGNRELLHALGKGATPHEQFLAERQSVSLWRYLQRVFANLIPGLDCIAPDSEIDAAACIMDIATLKGSVISLGGRQFKALARLPGILGQSAASSRLSAIRAARRWSNVPVPTSFNAPPTSPRRWHSAPELAQVTPQAGELTVQRKALPGQTPDALLLERIPGNEASAAWNLPGSATLIPRDDHTLDMIVQGAAYRLPPANSTGLARRLAHEPLLGHPPTEVPVPYPNLEAQIALNFSPPPHDAGTPRSGQKVSYAFQTVRIEPAPMRYRPQNTRFDIWAQVMVREGKVVVHAPRTPKGVRPLPAEQGQLRLGILSPPVYHRRIVVDPSPELRFGLPLDMPAEYVRTVTEHCPPVRLGGLARTIPDRRTLRGALIDWQDEQWLVVEADLGVFYGAPYQPWAWQMRLLDAPAQPHRLPQPPRALRRRLQRITDEHAIEKYLEISETYRIVAEHPDLQRDIDNLAQLLRDWIAQRRAFAPYLPSEYQAFFDSVQDELIPDYAANILTQNSAQDALAGLAKRGAIGLNKEIIPDWWQFNDASAPRRQRVLDILDHLLPAQGSHSAYTPMAGLERLDDGALQALRQHLYPANLAFASVTLKDQSRVVFFALSGTPGRRALEIAPQASAAGAVRYIDARQQNHGLPSDPRFSELTTLRRADFLSIRHHQRHLDAERHIAAALNRSLLERRDEVQRIEVFTLLDACRSCGGFVLPRLRLDYPHASFSVTWMIEYPD
ncbi:hypothetical protein F3J45_07880 [Pantoea sp. Ap-967]|uniref:deaminase domain-containing protein n=1 Tax=Pantoea sp. Ap-967 TaxID=2608362 RepID=UPI00141E4E86|nr:deaminase domain-containing protein [Pantoea sp. Ap-967]NIE74355.1 hypothetical protein [Pantoea sp. Ap-967]